MKINYYGYFLKNIATEEKVLFDIRPFLRAFCQYNNIAFKNQFMRGDEHLYVAMNTGDLFIFLMTRSSEIIKKINSSDLSINEIDSLFESNEHLGFASYVNIKEKFMGFGSTTMAPKFPVFIEFINDIFESLGIRDYEIAVQPILHQATRSEAMAMPFFGKATIEIEKENTLGQDILGVVGASIEDTEDIESLEIIVKPKRKKNIKGAVTKFMENIPDDGLKRLILKARDEAHTQLTDLYLVGKGAVSDVIDGKKESRINELMMTKLGANTHLARKLREFECDERFEEGAIEHILHFNDHTSWPDHFPDLLED